MKAYCRAHEAAARAAIEEGVTESVLEAHLEKIRWLQHERLVHLIVTAMVVIVELFVLAAVIMMPGFAEGSELLTRHPYIGLLPVCVMLGLAVLLGFYFYHYFFLENTVQRWYVIADEMREKLK